MIGMASSIQHHRCRCARTLWPTDCGELLRTDAKAEGELVVLGGWSLEHGPDTRRARWYSLRISPEQAPWLFEKEPFTVISTLELLATIIGIMLLVPEGLAERQRVGSAAISAGTDNQGNSYLATKLITTKFPLCLALLEMTSQLQARGLELNLQWLARESNQEADDLTNEKFDKFLP